MRLCDGLFSALFQFDGELLHQVAQHNFTPEALEEVRRVSRRAPAGARGQGGRSSSARWSTFPTSSVDPEFQHQALSRAVGLAKRPLRPMLREGAPIGVIVVDRAEPGPFSGQRDRAAEDLRRSGGHRRRERAAVQGMKEASQPRLDRDPARSSSVICCSPTNRSRCLTRSPKASDAPLFDAADCRFVGMFDGALHLTARSPTEVRKAYDAIHQPIPRTAV